MKLLSEEIKKILPQIGSTDNENDPMAQIKLFCPWNEWVWYVIEFNGEDLMYGKVRGFETELGYFNLSELENITGPMGLKIERDLYFEPKPLSQCQ